MPLTEQEEFELLSLEREKSLFQQQAQQPNQQQNIAFLPNLQRTEQMIASRQDPVQSLKEELMYSPDILQHPFKGNLDITLKPMITAMKAFGVPWGRAEAGVSSAGLAAQRTEPNKILPEMWAGLTGKRQSQLGDIIRTTGFGSVLNEPIASITGLLGAIGLGELATTGKLGVLGQGKTATQISKEAISETKTMGNFVKNRLPKIHNEDFVVSKAKQLKDLAGGLDEALHTTYDDFYKTQGINNIPIDYFKADEILLKNNIPNNILSEIDQTIGKIDSVQKAQRALNIIGKRISDPAWENVSKATKYSRQTWAELKSLMRETARPSNPEAVALLEKLDNFASTKIYPRINKFYKMVGRKGEPKTEALVSALRGGLGKTSTRMIEESPKTISEFSKYFKTPEFIDDINSLVNNANEIARGIKSFQSRQFQKGAGVVLATGGGIAALVTKLFKK